MSRLPDISNWDLNDIQSLPTDESDLFEFKSSAAKLDQLKNRISVAASAFWNSGGGIFIIGVDNNGKIDGGIPRTIGNKSVNDWIDNAVSLTEPVGKYQIQTIQLDENGSLVVGVIKFEESRLIPHMAYDKKYYVRVGSHSNSAGHFLVEALRSMRNYTTPKLKAVIRNCQSKPKIVEMVLVSVNDSPALDVSITFDPLPMYYKEKLSSYFPLEISVIDKNNPFSMDITAVGAVDQIFGKDQVRLVLEYSDTIGNRYHNTQLIDILKNKSPLTIGEESSEKLLKALDKIADRLGKKS